MSQNVPTPSNLNLRLCPVDPGYDSAESMVSEIIEREFQKKQTTFAVIQHIHIEGEITRESLLNGLEKSRKIFNSLCGSANSATVQMDIKTTYDCFTPELTSQIFTLIDEYLTNYPYQWNIPTTIDLETHVEEFSIGAETVATCISLYFSVLT